MKITRVLSVLRTIALVSFAVVFSLAQRQVAFGQQWNTNGNDISNANSGNVGVGTTTPVSALHVATESTAVPRGITNSQHSSDGNSPLLIFRKSRGTKLSPLAVINGDGLGNLQSQAYDGSSYITTARFKFAIDGTVSSGSAPTSIQFFTGSNASGIERMRISSSGNVGIGTSTPGYRLDVQGGQINSSGGLCIAGDCKTAWSQVGGSSQWTTSGSNIFYNTGSVGIGSTNPAVRLAINGNGVNVYNTDAWLENNMHVQGNETLTQGGRGRLRVGSAWGYSGLYSDVSSTGAANDLVLGAGSGNVRVGPGAASAQNFLVPNGNVGIGTTTPGTRLAVQGPVPSGTTDIFRVLPGATFNNTPLFTVSSVDTAGGSRAATRMSIYGDNGGNGGWLVFDWFNSISGNRGLFAGPNGISFYANAASTGGSPRAFTFRSVDLSPFGSPNAVVAVQNAAGSDLFLVQQGGNVGVGTAAPSFKLDVQSGQINSSGGLCIAGDCKTAWSQVGGSQWTTAGSTIHYNTGNVGVGTASPGSKLFVGSGTPAVATLAGLNVALGGASYVSASNGTENIFMGADGSGYGILGTLSNHSLGFRTNNSERVRIDTSGNVGVGTTAPTAKLHVAGDGRVTGNLTVDGNIAAKYQDVAEWVPAAHALPPATVVTLKPKHSNLVEASSKAYDTRVAGVISAQPGIALGERGENKVLVATTGRVRIKVDATKAAIEVGDLLVTSEKEGVAMKSEPINFGGVEIHRPGTIIGKALEPLAKGIGEILVLLSLQ